MRGWRIGSLAGIPVYLGYSWPIVGLVVVAFVGPALSASRPDLGTAAYVVGAGLALLLLVSVLVHEAAHALVGRAVGYDVTRVVADFWGGHTAYSSDDATPARTSLVAVVGPLSNGLLALLGWLALLVLDPDPGVPLALLTATVWANAFVAAFNMLPGLPLDGGFLVYSLLWRITGSRALGMVAAGWAGRVLALTVAFVVVGLPLLRGQTPSTTTVLWSLLIAGFLWFGASSSVKVGTNRRTLEKIPVERYLRPVVLVPGDRTLAEVAGLIPAPDAGRAVAVVVDATGRPLGTLDAAAVRSVPAAERSRVPASAVLSTRPPGWVLTPGTDPTLTPVVVAMQTHHTDAVLLADGVGGYRGAVLARDL